MIVLFTLTGCIGKRPVPGNPNAYQIVRPTVMKCPHGLVFNKELCACDWTVAGTFNVTKGKHQQSNEKHKQ